MTFRPAPRTTPRWEQAISALIRYVEVHGTADVPARARAQGVDVGAWVAKRRLDYRLHRLSGLEIATLECLPGWSWDGPSPSKVHTSAAGSQPRGRDAADTEAAWHRGYRVLLAYVGDNGTADVPRTLRFEDFPLGHWVQRQREHFASGTLQPERVQMLLRLAGWRWNVRGHSR